MLTFFILYSVCKLIPHNDYSSQPRIGTDVLYILQHSLVIFFSFMRSYIRTKTRVFWFLCRVGSVTSLFVMLMDRNYIKNVSYTNDVLTENKKTPK